MQCLEYFGYVTLLPSSLALKLHKKEGKSCTWSCNFPTAKTILERLVKIYRSVFLILRYFFFFPKICSYYRVSPQHIYVHNLSLWDILRKTCRQPINPCKHLQCMFVRVDMVGTNRNKVLKQWRHMPMGQFCADIFLMRITSTYFWASEVFKNLRFKSQLFSSSQQKKYPKLKIWANF